MERIQKIIAESGYCSRRRAEELILKGKVQVNGVVIHKLGVKAGPSDQVTVNGHNLKRENKEYVLLYKPRGVVTTTSDEKGRKTVLDIVDSLNRLYPVGRLDYDTSGLLLLTNDGNLTNMLIHPRNHIPKVYVAKIDGCVIPDKVRSLCKGVLIDGKRTGKCKVKIKKIDKKKNSSLVELTIYEGRNHQVKKMFEKIGYKVIKLKRESFAGLTLDGLSSSEYRHLSIKEVKRLYALCKKNIDK